jgi:hypothetical protein
MADALRQLIAEFLVSVDPGGELAKGHERIDALKAAAAGLEARLKALGEAAKPAARSFTDAFAKAQASVGDFLNLQNVKQFGGRDDANPFAAAGLQRSGPLLGPGREARDAGLAEQQRAAEAYANSLRGRLSSAFAAASRGADGFRGSGARLLDTLTSLQTGLVALGAGAALRFTAGLVNAVGNLGEASAQLGVTTDEFQRLDVLAKQNATSVQALGTAFRTLAKAAADPTKESAAAFKKLGVQTKGADGELKSRQALFFDTAGALAEVSNETERAALAQQLFGRSGLELLPLLSQGRAGLEGQRAALERMALVSPAAIKAADEFGDRWEIIKTELLAKVAPLLEKVVIPAFTKFLDVTLAFVDGLEKFIKQTDFAQAGIVALGFAAATLGPQMAVMVTLGGGVTRVFGGMALAAGRAAVAFARVALPLLFLEDVATFFSGGDSLTGRLMSWLFGEDAGAGIQKAAQDLLAALKELWDFVTGKGIGPALTQLGKDLSEAGGFFANDVGQAFASAFEPSAGGPFGNAQLNLPVPGINDYRQQSVTVNVGSTGEVAGAVAGAQQGLGRSPAAELAAAGG